MPETPQPLDGLSAPKPATPATSTPSPLIAPPEDPKTRAAIKKWKTLLLAGGALFYAGYVMWGVLLLGLLPSADPQLKSLVSLGVLSALFGGIVFLAIGAIGFMRITAANKLDVKIRQQSLMKLGIVTVPGLLLSIAIPLLITREPPIGIEIVNPTSAQALVAPIAMTFSLEKAVTTLAERNVRVTSYRWDVNGDGKMDQETVNPTLTVSFDREGVYNVSTTLVTSDGSRRVTRRFIIKAAVFTVLPNPAIVKKPMVLSVANIVKDLQQLQEVQWDFDQDGVVDETTKGPEVTYTMYQTGEFTVSVNIILTNNTQATYTRVINVENPQPLPFPVSIVTNPKNLISPPPFPVLFRIESDEPLSEVEWNFGDGRERETGERVLHEFTTKGTFIVTARVRAVSGTAATVDTLVRVVDELPLPDLVYESAVSIDGDRISGTVPLKLDILPKTTVQFVQFSWEAPEASEVGSTDGKLQAVYRKEGTYRLFMLAQDVVNRAVRKEFTVTVNPQKAVADFKIVPETGVAPLTVKMDSSDTSLPPDETPTGILWKCKENEPLRPGGGIDSCTFDQEGTYNITLLVRTQDGSEFTKTKTIVVRPPVITPCFLPTRTRAKVDQLIGFDLGCTSGAYDRMTVLWDFGDNTQLQWKPGEDTVHAYSKAGTYQVTLTFSDPTDPSRQFRSAPRTITIEP